MITLVKLVLLTIFMIISSKTIGAFVLEKCKKDTEETLGIGFLANLALFWIIQFFVMFFKLSTIYLNIFGGIYLAITISIIIRNIVKNKKFSFTKKEFIAIIITVLLMVLYCVFVNFGYIETYDSYFYGVLTNSASDTTNISVIDPYTGQKNLQNYYKYISYYYQATFLGNIAGIQDTYLVLIWVMTFMNYLFISATALTMVRITKNKYINNIFTAFLFTFLTSIFRAPFNALHLVTMIIPIYCFIYAFDLLKKDNSSVIPLLISIMATVTISSTSLFVILAFLYVVFAVASILDRRDMYIKIVSVGIPVILLAFLYIYESLDSYLPIALMMFVLTILYMLCINKKTLRILTIIGRASIAIVFIVLVAIGSVGVSKKAKNSFIKSDAIETENMIVVEESEGIEEITYEGKGLILDYEFDTAKHSSSMQYIYSDSQSIISKVFILGTHSTVLYGGMLALLIFGIIKKEKKPEFIAFYIYLIVFYNPLVRGGLSEIAMKLEARIYLFFNTIFSIYGIKYLIEYLDSKIGEKNWYNYIKKYVSYLYIVTVIVSIIAYVLNFKAIDTNKYDLICKVPNTLLQTEDFLQKYFDNKNDGKNIRIFYTANTFNISMVDENINEKIKIINSKEYMGYFENPEQVITDKLVISAFFDTEGQAKITNKMNEKNSIDRERVEKLIEYFNIEYITIKKPNSEEFIKYIEDNYEVIYYNDEVEVLKVN